MFRMHLLTCVFAGMLFLCGPGFVFGQDESEDASTEPPTVELKDLAEAEAMRARLAPKSMMLDGHMLNGKIFVVGDRGHILVSTDQGKTWEQQVVPTRNMLTAVHFVDENLGFAVGHDEIIMRTQDGGQTWKKIRFEPEEERPFLDVWFRDKDFGMAIGAYGSVLLTTDGGETWESRMLGEYEDFHLNAIAMSDSGKLYIAAEAGNMYRSDDMGETWVKLESPYEGSFFGVLPLANDVVYMFGLRGNMFRSEDAGETWEEVDTQTEAILTDGVQLEDGRIFVAGMGGALLESRDGGETFTLRQQSDRQGIAKLLPNQNGLLLIGEAGVWSYKPQ